MSNISRLSNNRSHKVVNKTILSHPIIIVFIEYLPHFDNQSAIIIRLLNRKKLIIFPAII